jgi:hypothetical protein
VATERPLNPWYVTGLVELAGAFTFSRSDRNVALYFGLKVQGACKPILDAVQEHFGGVGRVYTVSNRLSALSDERRVSHYYRVTRLDDLDLIVQHFGDYPLRGHKAKAYEIWRDMVHLKRVSHRKPLRAQLDALCERLSSLNPHAPLRRPGNA